MRTGAVGPTGPVGPTGSPGRSRQPATGPTGTAGTAYTGVLDLKSMNKDEVTRFIQNQLGSYGDWDQFAQSAAGMSGSMLTAALIAKGISARQIKTWKTNLQKNSTAGQISSTVSGVESGVGSAVDTAAGVGESLASVVADAIQTPLDFLKFIGWLFHPVNILRMVEFTTGLGIMGGGIWMLFFRRAKPPSLMKSLYQTLE